MHDSWHQSLSSGIIFRWNNALQWGISEYIKKSIKLVGYISILQLCCVYLVFIMIKKIALLSTIVSLSLFLGACKSNEPSEIDVQQALQKLSNVSFGINNAPKVESIKNISCKETEGAPPAVFCKYVAIMDGSKYNLINRNFLHKFRRSY